MHLVQELEVSLERNKDKKRIGAVRQASKQKHAPLLQ